LKASIMDESQADPSAVKLMVNGRYPDTVPLTSVPPQVLQTLPKLTEDLEYRFIGDALILLDVHAHVIADFIQRVPNQLNGGLMRMRRWSLSHSRPPDLTAAIAARPPPADSPAHCRTRMDR
jgi:hypothetical protein